MTDKFKILDAEKVGEGKTSPEPAQRECPFSMVAVPVPVPPDPKARFNPRQQEPAVMFVGQRAACGPPCALYDAVGKRTCLEQVLGAFVREPPPFGSASEDPPALTNHEARNVLSNIRAAFKSGDAGRLKVVLEGLSG